VCVLVLVCCSQALCPSLIRVVNALVPSTQSIDLNINGTLFASGVSFRSVTGYFSVTPGFLTVYILQSGTPNNLGIRSFQAAPGVAYTVAITGSLSSATGNLLFNSSPFVFYDNINVPTPGTFRGTYYRLAESNATQNFQVVEQTYTSLAPFIDPKTSTGFADQLPGGVLFQATTTNGVVVNNSAGSPEQLHAVVGSEVIFDLFLIGDDSNAVNPAIFASTSNSPSYDPVSGCVLLPGINVLPNPTPQPPIFSFTPCNSAMSTVPTVALLLAVLLALFL